MQLSGQHAARVLRQRLLIVVTVAGSVQAAGVTVEAGGSDFYKGFDESAVAGSSSGSVRLATATRWAHPEANGQWGAEVMNHQPLRYRPGRLPARPYHTPRPPRRPVPEPATDPGPTTAPTVQPRITAPAPAPPSTASPWSP